MDQILYDAKISFKNNDEETRGLLPTAVNVKKNNDKNHSQAIDH